MKYLLFVLFEILTAGNEVNIRFNHISLIENVREIVADYIRGNEHGGRRAVHYGYSIVPDSYFICTLLVLHVE